MFLFLIFINTGLLRKKFKSGAIHGKDEVFCKVNGNRECAYRVPASGPNLFLHKVDSLLVVVVVKY